MALYDSAELLTTIKLRGMVPVNAGSWSDAELLRAASEEVDTWHLPLLVDARGEYLVKEQVIACVVDQAAYLVNYRAAAVRSVLLRKSDGTEQPIDEVSASKQSRLFFDRTLKGVPQFYAFREGYIDLYPKPDATTYSLVVKWHISPNRIVLVTDCRQILSKAVDTPTAGKTRLTLASAVPTALAGASGTLYDFVGVRKPFPIKGWDVASQSTVTDGVSTTVDFTTADLPSDLTVAAGVNGDWLCATQKSPHPNVPHELHSAIALRAGAAAIAARDPAVQATLLREAKMKEQELLNGILAPRNKGAVKRLVQRRW